MHNFANEFQCVPWRVRSDIVVDFGCGYGEYTIAIALSLKNEGTVFVFSCCK